jgi:hypothetical protein
MSRRLSIHEDLYAELVALAARYDCTVTRLLCELAELGQIISEARRIEFYLPNQPGGTVRIWLPQSTHIWPDHGAPLSEKDARTDG